MKFLKVKNKSSLAVFGKNQVSDWNILSGVSIIILISVIVLGFFVYKHIGNEISRDASYFYVEGQSVDVEKVDKVISEIELRKSNFERFSTN
jgi:hypothetical protein